MLCLALYLVLAALASFSLRLKNGRKFLNRVNYLLWKGCGQAAYSGIKHQILEICPTFVFLTFELVTITCIHISLQLSKEPVINQLAWFSLYLTRVSLILQDHLANAIGRCLMVAFREMNDEILAWEFSKFSQKLFINRNKLMTLTRGNSTLINFAADRFSYLSLALKELHQHYEFFWLPYFGHLCSVLIFMLAIIFLQDITTFTFINAMFSSVTTAKLLLVCFLLGDTSVQVSVFHEKAYRQCYGLLSIIVGGTSCGINWTHYGKNRGP
jgi:hypothetical protein